MPELGEIVGQDEAISRLERAMAAERIPHAYIFAGPAGIGRRTTATALARTLLCERPTGGRAARRSCGKCENCLMMEAGSHPDFHLVHKELAAYHDDPDVRSRKMQDLGIDVIRSFLIRPAYLSATRGRGKVFVVLEAELMSAPAQNALLKTLEEPPAGVTIILICRQPEQLLPTTLSRCWTIRFNLLPRDFVTETLADRGLKRQEAAFWSAFTGGSLGRAAELAEQGLYELKIEMVDRLAAGDEADLAEHLTKVADGLASAAVSRSKKDDGPELAKSVATRRSAGAVLELLASAFRDALRLATGSDKAITNIDQGRAVEALSRRLGADKLAEAIEQLSEYERLLWRNVNPKLVWDNVAVTCTSGAPLRL